MRVITVLLVVGTALTVPVGAQQPVPPPPASPIPESGNPQLKATQMRIVVKGCVSGRQLYAAADDTPESIFRTLRVTSFALSGSKELIRQIESRHDGHWDEIEGVVTVPPPTGKGESRVTTKQIGKTRVTVAGRQSDDASVQESPKALTLKVSRLTHLTEGCALHTH
jgi:hypothetical protein